MGSKTTSKVEDISITTDATGKTKTVTVDATKNLDSIKISNNGYYFSLWRKLDTKDAIDAVQKCGTVTDHVWLAKTVNTKTTFDKNGRWKLKLEGDCTVVNAGAFALSTGITIALVAASLY